MFSKINNRVRKRKPVAESLPTIAAPSPTSKYSAQVLREYQDMQSPKSNKAVIRCCLYIRSFLLFLIMTSFPFVIFILPNLQQYPRIVVAIATTPSQLPQLLEAGTIESLIQGQSVPPDTVYLVLPSNDFFSKESLEYPPLPAELEGEETLKVLQPPYHFGPVSSILYALKNELAMEEKEKEESENKKDESVVDPTTVTRIIALDDQHQFYHSKFVKKLIDASINFPESAIALMGVQLRSDFRQVFSFPGSSSDQEEAEIHDKFPNLVVRPGKEPIYFEKVDIISFPFSVNTDMLSHKELYDRLQNTLVSDDMKESADIVVSALLESRNVTKRSMPFSDIVDPPQGSGDSINATSWSEGKRWMQSTYELQKTFKVWKDFHFLNPKELGKDMVEAIQCEASHEQDCESREGACLVDAESCSAEALSLLQTLNPPPTEKESTS